MAEHIQFVEDTLKEAHLKIKELTQDKSCLKTDFQKLRVQIMADMDFRNEIMIQEKYLLDRLVNNQKKQNGTNSSFQHSANQMVDENLHLDQLIEECNAKL